MASDRGGGSGNGRVRVVVGAVVLVAGLIVVVGLGSGRERVRCGRVVAVIGAV